MRHFTFILSDNIYVIIIALTVWVMQCSSSSSGESVSTTTSNNKRIKWHGDCDLFQLPLTASTDDEWCDAIVLLLQQACRRIILCRVVDHLKVSLLRYVLYVRPENTSKRNYIIIKEIRGIQLNIWIIFEMSFHLISLPSVQYIIKLIIIRQCVFVFIYLSSPSTMYVFVGCAIYTRNILPVFGYFHSIIINNN